MKMTDEEYERLKHEDAKNLREHLDQNTMMSDVMRKSLECTIEKIENTPGELQRIIETQTQIMIENGELEVDEKEGTYRITEKGHAKLNENHDEGIIWDGHKVTTPNMKKR